MQYDYYYHDGQMHQITLRQEAENERLLQALQRGDPKFYHHWAIWLGRSMMQSGQQLLQFGNRGHNSVTTTSPRHAALPVSGGHALKATHMLPEGKL